MSKLFYWTINLLIFLLPIYLFRFEIAGLPTNFFEIYFLFVFIWWIGEKEYKKHKNSKDDFMLIFHQFINRDRLLFSGISLLLIGVSLSTVFSSNKLTSLGILKSWFIVPIMLVWMIINIFSENLKLKTKKSFYHPVSLLKSLAFSGLIVAFVSLGYLFNGNLTYDGRLKAFFEHPNHLAMYLAPCWLIVYGLWLMTTGKNEKKLWLSSVILISIPIFFTYSYGAWLGIVAGMSFMLWGLMRINRGKKGYKRKKKKWLYGFIVILLIIVVGLIQLNQPKFQNIFTTECSSFHSRLMIWRSASHILEDNWFLGISPGTFQEYYLNYQKYFPPYLEWAVPQPHNIFLAFWLQTGIIGFIGFIVILVWFFRTGLKAIHKISKNKKEALTAYGLYSSITLTLMAIMTYIIIHGLVDTLYWKNDLAVVFWLIIGLMSIISHQNYSQRKESPLCQKQ